MANRTGRGGISSHGVCVGAADAEARNASAQGGPDGVAVRRPVGQALVHVERGVPEAETGVKQG